MTAPLFNFMLVTHEGCVETPTLASIVERLRPIVADLRLLRDSLADQVRTNSERGVTLLADLSAAADLLFALQGFAK